VLDRYHWYRCHLNPAKSPQLAGFSVKSLWRLVELAIKV
jgi:hypothetical protein